jgi:hypothetical protein
LEKDVQLVDFIRTKRE